MKIEKGAPMPKVEKGVPLPPKTNRKKYPWDRLESGDSFLIQRGDWPSARVAANMWLKRHAPGWNYASRREGDVVRIWFFAPGELPEE